MQFEVNVNTYMTVEEADSIIEDIYFEDDEEYILWQTFDEVGKQRMILQGTRLIEKLTFLGISIPGYQSMKWPRLIQYRYVDCPYDVKVAILKQAIKDKINQAKSEYDLQELGVKSYSIKGASISFSDNMKQGKLSNGIYDTIFDEYLSNWVY